MYIPKHYKTEELVSRLMYDKLQESVLEVLPAHVLECLDTIRTELGRAVTINTWSTNPNGYNENGFVCFDDKSYRATVERSVFTRLNKQWLGLEYNLAFNGLTAEEALTLLDSKIKNKQSVLFGKVESITQCKQPGLSNFVKITFKGNI
jgi:hypothetical protein